MSACSRIQRHAGTEDMPSRQQRTGPVDGFNTKQQPRECIRLHQPRSKQQRQQLESLGGCEAQARTSSAACHTLWAVARRAVAMQPAGAAARFLTLTCLCVSFRVLVTSWSAAPCLLACVTAVHVRRQVHSGYSYSPGRCTQLVSLAGTRGCQRCGWHTLELSSCI